MQRTALCLARCLAPLVFAPTSLAAQLQVTPAPGWWESRTVLNVSGIDIVQMQTQILAALPPDQREQAIAQMKAAGVSTQEPGVARYCVSPAQAEKARDPAAAIGEVNRSVRQCRFEPTTVGATEVQFRGRCDDPRTFTGNVAGRFTMTEPKSWTIDFHGRGTLAGITLGAPLPAQGRTVARWVAADCAAQATK
ncbi:MAG TPA: DUF3617 domain-containing protein [Burkholderiaceae bacterium]|nr:DUF3617 domain-containing protein [Burkholderiaceae bacterium]